MKRLHRVAARLLRWNRVACLLLILCLLSSSTPAAPQTIVAFAEESRVNFAFWFNSSSLAKLIQGRGGSGLTQETQRTRDARIARIEIYPKNATIDLDDQVRFAAVAYDAAGHTVGGVKITWSGRSLVPDLRVRLSPIGEFRAIVAGTFKVTAEANGKTAEVDVVVRPGVRRNLNGPVLGTRPVSSRDVPTVRIGSTKQEKNSDKQSNKTDQRRTRAELAKRSHASKATIAEPEPMPQGGGGGWDSSNYWSADDPGNRVGDPPGSTPDGGAGSGNFQLAAPIYSAPGRGINISLGLAYNSRVWNKANTQMSYDNDRGWPAPGWSLGFGKLLGIGVYQGCMIVDADGTRHGYTGTITEYSWGTYGVMHTTDGSLIDYTYTTGINGVITGAQAKLPNGTIISYGAYSQPGGGVFPTYIEDANGNFITITYVNNSGPRIQTVTDAQGKVINFHYEAGNLLTAITVPGLNGGTREAIRIRYRQLTLNPGFNGLTVVARDWNPWVVEAIYYPGTSTGLWFGDPDSYSSYGMIAKVIEQRGMGFSAGSVNEQGTVTQGLLTRRDTYNYPLGPDYSLIDAPTYTLLTQDWTRDGINLDSATTGYQVYENATPRMTIITLPNGMKSKQLSYNRPGQYDDGLVYHDETYVTEGQPLQSSDSFWEPGAYGSPRPTRVEKRDERNQMTKAEFSYGPVYNQVTEVRDYGYSGELLRSTRTTYQNSVSYTGTCYSTGCYGRHIFNLPLDVEVYAGDGVTRLSRTEYQYDGHSLTAAPNVVMHNQAANPYAEAEGFCYWQDDWNDPDCSSGCWWGECCCDGQCNQIFICPYDSSTDYRGNVTQVTSYADAANLTGAVTETRRYDITGNLVTASTSCCEQTSFNYTVDTQYAYPQSQTRGSANDAFKQMTTSASYDFNTGLALSATDANGRVSQAGFDANTLRPMSTISPTGAHTDYVYDDLAMTVTSTTYLVPGTNGPIVNQTIKLLNGNGQVRQEKARGPDSSGQPTWDAVDSIFNNLGQVTQQSRPYRVGGGSPIFSSATVDALGRVNRVTAPDGSVTETYYNEIDFDPNDGYTPQRPDVVSSAPGETTLLRDAWGRERWGRTDATGRLVEVVEPNPNGNGSVATGGLITTYTYSPLGHLTQINQGDQTRRFKHDSLGRLTRQKLAEVSATLNDTGTYVGVGGPGAQWGDVFTYDERSNVTSRTDARGVKTVYNYGNDQLNRLQSVSWDTGGFGDTNNPILPAATVTYQYRQKSTGAELKDITQLESVTTAGVSTESYGFDTEGRVSSKTLTLASRPNHPFETNYTYDNLDRVTDVLYPKQWGNGQQPRKTVHHDYDIASRLSGLTYDGQSFASNIVYNAASQTTSLNVGAAGANQITESYGYNAQTGLLDNQTVARTATPTNYLLNLSYDYANGSGKRTGQLTKILNNLNPNKDRGYSYDALGRLVEASGGVNGALWTQTYSYDRYGNRTSVTASGYSAKNTGGNQSVREGGDIARRDRKSDPPALAGESSGSNTQPSDPKVELPTDLLAKNNRVELPRELLPNSDGAISDTTTPLYRSATGHALTPQGQPINVALASNGGIATASSSYPGGYGPSGANNGGRKGDSASDYWNDDAPTNTFPDWLQIDFNGSKTIGEIDVFTIQDNYQNPSEPTESMTFSLCGLTGFDVQYWNGTSWVTVPGGSVSGNNKVWKKITFTAIITTKIRVLTNAAAPADGYSRITEVEAWTSTAAPPPTNVALAANGGIATASSSYPGGYGPGGTINGGRKGDSAGDYWNDDAPGNTFPDWLQIDFNGSKTIGEIDVFTIQDNYQNPSEPTESMTFSLYGLTGFDVQYWNGTSWVTVPGGSVSGNNKVWKKITFTAIITTKIRVLTNAAAPADGYSRITEVEAWTSTAAPPPTNVALAANGGIATASSSYPGGYGPGGTINGGRKGDSAGDYWNDDAPGNTFPDWLQIEFNGSKTIGEIDVFTIQDNYQNPSEPTEAMTFSLYGLTGFDVQYWNGSAWATVPGGSVTGNNKVWKKITFSAITTTKIRVLTNACPDGYSRIAELEAWTATAGGGPSSPIPTDGIVSLTYDSASNRITTSGFEYDAAGNQVRAPIPGGGGSQRYRYDAANRLAQVRNDDNNIVIASYTYGDNNQRLIAEETTTRTYYVAEGLSVVAEYEEVGGSTNPAWSKSYIYLGNRLLSSLTRNGAGGEAVEHQHPDRLGTRLVTNPTTGGSFEHVALPFGTALGGESTGETKRRFTSYDRSDTTKLDYAVNRHYDAQQGRFTQVDPIGMRSVSLSIPQTMNLYAYCANDPINRVDSDGLGLISFFKKLFRGIAKILTNKWVLLIAGIALGVLSGFGFFMAFKGGVIAGTAVNTAYLKAAIALAAMSALLIVGAFHQNFLRVVQTIGGIVSSIQGALGAIRGVINGGSLGTPPWNPDSGVGAVSNFMAAQRQRRPRRDHVEELVNEIRRLRERLGERYDDFIETINNNKNSRISTAVVLCQASQESSFLNLNYTGSGFEETTPGLIDEVGLLQIRPATAQSLGVNPADLTNVATNVTTGTGYLTGLLNRNGGDLFTALGKYKGGSGPLTAASRRYADQIIQCSKRVQY